MTVEDSRHGAHALWGVRPVDHSKLYYRTTAVGRSHSSGETVFPSLTVSLLHVVLYKK